MKLLLTTLSLLATAKGVVARKDHELRVSVGGVACGLGWRGGSMLFEYEEPDGALVHR